MRCGSLRPLSPGNLTGDDDAARYDAVICMLEGRARFFADDLRTTCANCGRAIHQQPYAAEKPSAICLYCFVSNFDGE